MTTQGLGSSVGINVRAPKLGAVSALGLAVQLLARVPARAPANVVAAAKKLKKKRDALEGAWTRRERSQRSAAVRPLVYAVSNAFSALVERLTAYARLPADRFPHAGRAKEIVDTIFPGGGALVTLESTGAWTQCDLRLKRMRDEGMAHDAERLAGADVMAYVNQTHEALGAALGIGVRPEPEEQGDPVGVALRAVNEAISGYALRIAAMYDPDDDPDGTMFQTVREALKPLEVMREKTARAGGNAGTDDGAADDTSSPVETAIVPASAASLAR